MDGDAMKTSLEIAKAVYAAYVTKDRAAIEQLLTDDFHFTSPLDNALDRRAYLEICWPNSETTASFEIKYLAEDGDQVFVTYEAKSSGGKHFRNTEVLTIRGEQVAAVEVYFGWNVPHSVPPGCHRDPEHVPG
jgi:ketosteroid isomerase-like protein